MKISIITILTLLFLSCSNQDKKEQLENVKIQHKKSIFDCITARDTLFATGDYIKYIEIDTLIGIEIKIGNQRDTLKDLYSCLTSNMSIQHLYKYSSNILYLTEGSGQQYIRIHVYYLLNGKIQYYCNETSLIYPESPHIIVYKNITNGKICIHDYDTEKTSYLQLPSKYKDEELETTEVFPNYLIFKFRNGIEYKIKYK